MEDSSKTESLIIAAENRITGQPVPWWTDIKLNWISEIIFFSTVIEVLFLWINQKNFFLLLRNVSYLGILSNVLQMIIHPLTLSCLGYC